MYYYGYIKDANTGQGLNGVNVQLVANNNGQVLDSNTTNSDGLFAVNGDGDESKMFFNVNKYGYGQATMPVAGWNNGESVEVYNLGVTKFKIPVWIWILLALAIGAGAFLYFKKRK